MKLPSASRIDIAAECDGIMVLPWTDHDSDDAERGRAIHEFIDRARKQGRATALAAVRDEELRAVCEAIDLAALPPNAESEVAIAYDLDTGKAERLHLAAHRAYPDDGRLVGTFDLVGRADDALIYYDFKTGWLTKPAATSRQLKAGALFGCALTGCTSARVGNLQLRHDGRWFLDRAELDAFDLDAFADELRAIIARGRRAQATIDAGGIPTLHAGAWCRYCPAFDQCPAQHALVAATVRDIAGIEARIEALSPAEKGEAWQRLKLAEQAVARVKATLQDCARREPFPIGDGYELREVPWGVQVQSPTAKAEIAALKDALRDHGEITTGRTTQVRPVRIRD